jgi:hypothetical protein
MIYIYPIGGLGNMFFHIASIYSLAKDNNDNLCLINIPHKIDNLKADTRCDISHADNYNYLFERFYRANINVPQKLHYPFECVPLQYVSDHEYIGYFQSENYFKHRKDEILDLFQPTIEMEEHLNTKYGDLFGNISLHVRRKDYANLYPHLHPPQTMDYYNRALEILPKDLKVLVFSDELLWCKNNFIGDRFVFIDEVDYISMYLMTRMKCNIIANSSFSWWGAWMNKNEDKTVITPVNWFGGHLLGDELKMKIIPENWIKI